MKAIEHKLEMSISFSCHNLDEIKELLPEIATLQKKYDVSLAISYSAGTDWSFPYQKNGAERTPLSKAISSLDESLSFACQGNRNSKPGKDHK